LPAAIGRCSADASKPIVIEPSSRSAAAALTLSLILVPASGSGTAGQKPLTPTAHAALPAEASDFWFVPSSSDRTSRGYKQYEPLAEAVQHFDEGEYQDAIRLASRASLADTPLAGYAAYYTGLSQLRLLKTSEARATLERLLREEPPGALSLAIALAAGEAAETAGDNAAALAIYDRLAADKVTVTDEVLSRLGRTALAVGDNRKAADAYVRLYYEYPLTAAGTASAAQLDSLAAHITRRGYDADIGRAQMFYGAGRYEEAKAAFAAVRPNVRGDERELVDLRIAESDYYLKNYAAARDGLRPYIERASRLAEARFFYLGAIRELGDHPQYVSLARALVTDFPDSSWAEEALNNLGTHYILEDEDAAAAETFKELYEKFPSGRRAERAAWKYGWSAYKAREYAETIRVFESAAAAFPRSDYRPSYLYWTARAHAKKGSASESAARMRLVYTDYANSYYGRLAAGHLRRAGSLPSSPVAHASQTSAAPAATLPNEATVRLLLSIGLYDAAIGELRYAQRAVGNSPAIDATIAWAYNRKGELRRAITLMRRAYPQFLSSGGDQLPSEILQVIFPLTYWPAIQREANARKLDPYLVAALIAQESTFDPKIRSAANAWGLMQILPSTGRQLARTVGIRRFRTATLTDPNANLKIGTYYFSRLVRQFGGTYYALASYNAGENRVERWKKERPGMDEDEFIDDIPFPETQNYVKRILGTAEDYRLLYGPGGEGRAQAVTATR
jgi:soluble lytic murein transglycosylase